MLHCHQRVVGGSASARPLTVRLMKPVRPQPSIRRAGRCAATEEAQEAPAIEKTGPNMPAVKEIQEIMQLLPHRYPFLLVDRVVEWESGKYAVGYKNVTINDNFFPGHFPERAIMPGVLQVEAMAQLGGLAIVDPEEPTKEFFFGGVDKVRWRRPVVPGDCLMMRVEVKKLNKRFGICKLEGKAYVGEQLACEAELTLALAT